MLSQVDILMVVLNAERKTQLSSIMVRGISALHAKRISNITDTIFH
jgi:hypothetical protein